MRFALDLFQQTKGRPTFIILDSHIAYGSPHRQDTPEAHGDPLGDDEVRLTKRAYGWPEDAQFLVPDGVYDHFKAGIGKRGAESRKKWADLFAYYRAKFPELALEINQMQRRELPTFGASAPLKELQKKFGFEPGNVVTVAKELLGARL
jgi:transketolase